MKLFWTCSCLCELLSVYDMTAWEKDWFTDAAPKYLLSESALDLPWGIATQLAGRSNQRPNLHPDASSCSCIDPVVDQ